MNKLFFLDQSNGIEKSYNDLINDLNNTLFLNRLILTQTTFDIFKQLIISLILDEEITLLDSDFSNNELKHLGITENDISAQISIPSLELKSVEDLLERIVTTHKWRIALYTSGTTGLPKKIKHNFQSLNRYLKLAEKHKNNIWGLAYNPTHIAGLQVFFQALLNTNSIINFYQLNRSEVFTAIKNHCVTHISGTPTFFRLLLPLSESFPNVQRISVGGEKFDESLARHIKSIFPSAKILNIYASTEAGTLFSSNGDYFTIKEDIKAMVKVVDDELLIHQSLLGNSDIFQNDWFNTGDKIEVLSRDPLTIKFLSRKDDIIKIAGNKVDPIEVEEYIKTFPGVKNCRVYARDNTVTGKILLCDIETLDREFDEIELSKYLSNNLQSFKVPRFFNVVDRIPLTRTGKVKRQ